MKLFSCFSILLFGTSAFCEINDGPTEVHMIQTNCISIGRLINKMGYTMSPYFHQDSEEDLKICDNNRYVAEDYVSIMEQVAERALKANCFEATIDRMNKSVSFRLLHKNRVAINTSKGEEHYVFRGYDRESMRGYERQKVINLCVLDESVIEWPYTSIAPSLDEMPTLDADLESYFPSDYNNKKDILLHFTFSYSVSPESKTSYSLSFANVSLLPYEGRPDGVPNDISARFSFPSFCDASNLEILKAQVSTDKFKLTELKDKKFLIDIETPYADAVSCLELQIFTKDDTPVSSMKLSIFTPFY